MTSEKYIGIHMPEESVTWRYCFCYINEKK